MAIYLIDYMLLMSRYLKSTTLLLLSMHYIHWFILITLLTPKCVNPYANRILNGNQNTIIANGIVINKTNTQKSRYTLHCTCLENLCLALNEKIGKNSFQTLIPTLTNFLFQVRVTFRIRVTVRFKVRIRVRVRVSYKNINL